MSTDLVRFKELIGMAASGRPLTLDEAADAFSIMMAGDATPAQMAGLLMALRVRGEHVDEITAGAQTLPPTDDADHRPGRCHRHLRHGR